jgi:mRNA interferase RelE/StbE
MYRIVVVRSAQKALKRIPRKMQQKICEEIDRLAINPFMGKKLEGNLGGRYTVRVWPYRIIYRIEKKIVTVYILKIGHRQGVYR